MFGPPKPCAVCSMLRYGNAILTTYPSGMAVPDPDRAELQAAELPRVTMLTKPGCHLCDVAREVVERVGAELDTAWSERDITHSEADHRAYWDKVPVILVDGVEHAYGRVSAERLRRALRTGAGTVADRPPGRSGGALATAVRRHLRPGPS